MITINKNLSLMNLFAAVALAALMAGLIIYPNPKALKVGIALAFAFVGLYVPQSVLFFAALLVMLAPKSAGSLMNTSDIVIIGVSGMFFIRSALGKSSPFSLLAIKKNSFFSISVVILLVYLLSLLMVLSSGRPGAAKNISFMVGLGSALLMANLVIGFIRDQQRLKMIQNFLVAILLLNLFFGFLNIFFPGMKVLYSGDSAGSVQVGSGLNAAMRLGGLFFFWEAYAEYLMMCIVILLGWIMGKGGAERKNIKLFFSAVLMVAGIELLLTNTRGATIIVIAGIALVILTVSQGNLERKIVTLCLLLLMGGIVLSLAQASGEFELFNRMETFQEIEQTKYGAMPRDRAMVWVPALNHIEEHNGIGTGPSLYPETYYKGGYGIMPWPHNLVLLILCTVGVPGILAFIYLLYRIVILKKTISKIHSSSSRLFYHLCWLAILLFFLDEMKFDGWLRMPDSYFYFIWFFIATLFSVETIHNEQ